MPVIQNWDLYLTTDQVLRAQGADPSVIRQRKPALVEIAEWALAEGLPLLNPMVAYREYPVEAFLHERLILSDEQSGAGSVKSMEERPRAKRPVLSGALISQHLGAAEKVVALVCTIGGLLDEVVGELMPDDPLRGLALDGLGSAAVEALAVAACNYFEQQAAQAGMQTTLPFSPGMVGWPVEKGQPEVFALVNSSEIGVWLNNNQMMQPRKSLSMVIGQGRDVGAGGETCDFCTIRETCRYRLSDIKVHYG